MLIELSHSFGHGTITYPGLPGPEITDHLSRAASRAIYAQGTDFHIGRISMVANTGTYVDVPFHRFPEGNDLAGTSLERLADLEGVLVDCRDHHRIGADVLQRSMVRGRAVVLRTDCSRHGGTDSD